VTKWVPRRDMVGFQNISVNFRERGKTTTGKKLDNRTFRGRKGGGGGDSWGGGQKGYDEIHC